jgi:hypothetical protein
MRFGKGNTGGGKPKEGSKAEERKERPAFERKEDRVLRKGMRARKM